MSRIYENHNISNDLIPIIFHTDVLTGEYCDGRIADVNWHDNIELLFVLEGEGELCIDSEKITMSPGNIYVINSYRFHGAYTKSYIRYNCLIIDNEFCRTNGIDTENLLIDEEIKDQAVADAYESVSKAFFKSRENIGYVPELRCAVLKLLVEIADRHITAGGSDKTRYEASKRIKNVMIYIMKNYEKTLTLEDIAMNTGMNKYHLSREFKKYTSATIFEYLNAVRCKEAKRLISGGATVSEAALSCGFDNFSYFSRTYRKYMGVLPSEHKTWREKK